MASGHCLCGRIRFVTDGEPQWVAYCHCGFCRRHTASPVACFVNFALDRVHFEGTPASYESSPGVTRRATCGFAIHHCATSRSVGVPLCSTLVDSP